MAAHLTWVNSDSLEVFITWLLKYLEPQLLIFSPSNTFFKVNHYLLSMAWQTGGII